MTGVEWALIALAIVAVLIALIFESAGIIRAMADCATDKETCELLIQRTWDQLCYNKCIGKPDDYGRRRCRECCEDLMWEHLSDCDRGCGRTVIDTWDTLQVDYIRSTSNSLCLCQGCPY